MKNQINSKDVKQFIDNNLETFNRNFNGITSTKLPRLELIPKSTLNALALRFELGIERKGEGAWNALTPEKEISKELMIERLSHCIHHCFDAIHKLVLNEPLSGEDDAGAILFAGSLLAEFRARSRARN